MQFAKIKFRMDRITKMIIKYKVTAPLCLTCLLPLLVVGCGSDSASDISDSMTSPNVSGIPSLENVYTYQSSVLSEEVLSCSTLFLSSNSCSVADIKPIGADSSTDISLEDIQNRLVISHDWMADSFISTLQEIDDQDLLNLFKPINTIVLSYDINPSFYHSYTASIYIDPRYLWRDTDEWESIYEQDDYRDSYQSEFIFTSVWRYVEASSGDYITWSNTYSEGSYESRSSAQIAPGLFRLLSHELAHANDYLPAEYLSTLGDSGTIYDDYIATAIRINDQLTDEIPLTSELLYEAADIAYGGSEITELIKNTSALEAGNAFEYDGAADLYGYSTQAEDVAMLFETFMMYKKYAAARDVAFVTVPTTDDYSCDDYVVKWGQRNRLADSDVKTRVILSGSMILNRDITSDFSSFSSELLNMETDIGWCSSRTSTDTLTNESVSSQTLTNTNDQLTQRVIHNYRDDFMRN